jgi:hypothetical protein
MLTNLSKNTNYKILQKSVQWKLRDTMKLTVTSYNSFEKRPKNGMENINHVN